MANLADRLDVTAEAWRPEVGEKLIGVVVDLDERISSYDGATKYPVVTVQDDAGTCLAWHAFHAVARAQLAQAAPVIGDRIGIKFSGKHPEKGYALWVVRVDRAPVAPDWQRIGADAQTELGGAADNNGIPF
jgi:hypothetical protein